MRRVTAGVIFLLFGAGALRAQEPAAAKPPSIEEIRVTMGKWMETQQIISRERKEWEQGQSLLKSRIELARQEIGGLEEKIKQAQTSAGEADKRRKDALAETEKYKQAAAQLTSAVTALEVQIRSLMKKLPQPLAEKLKATPLWQRIPEDPAETKVSVAERFQNVLGLLNEVNKANNEITVSFEVHELADGKPAEVDVIYVGLAQAYYRSKKGEAGIGRPGEDGWIWEPSKAVSADVLVALEIASGKHTPAFVPLPVKIR